MKSRKIAILALLTATMCLAALLAPAPVAAAPAWVAPRDGGDNDMAKAMIVAPNSNVWMFGDQYDGAGGCDIITQKLNGDTGQELFPPKIYDSPNNNPDHAKAAAQFAAGGVVVVGHTDLPLHSNWRIVRYGGAGDFKWQRPYNGDASGDDIAEDVAIAPDDYFYVAGWSENADDTKDMVIQRYWRGNRDIIWTVRFPDHPVWCQVEKPVHVEVDSSGNAYLAGSVYVSMYGDYRWYLNKYETTGYNPWSLVFGRLTGGQNWELRDMVVVSDYAYLTGKVTDEDGVQMITYKVPLDGTWNGAWAAVVDFSGHDATGTNVAADSSGNVYVLGRCPEPVNANTSLLVKYNASGVQQWLETFTTSPSGNQSLAVDGSSRAVVTAQSYPDKQYVTRWFNPANGDISNEETYPESGHGYPAAVGVDSSNNVYVTGSGRFDAVWPSDPDQDIRTLKYTAP